MRRLRGGSIKRHQLVVEFRRVFINGSKQCGVAPNTRHRTSHVCLVSGYLGCIDGLGLSHAVLDDIFPRLGIHGFTFPQYGKAQTQSFRRTVDNAVDMATDASNGDRKAKRFAVLSASV